MSKSRWVGFVTGGLVLLVASVSQAQCGKDTDCKGQRVCEAGGCVAPAAPLPASPPAPTGALAPANAAAPAAATPAAAAPATPKMQRHNTGMMAGGIVMVSLTPVALIVAGVAGLGKSLCNIDHSEASCDRDYDPTLYGSLVSALVLFGVGLPLLIVGAQKEPVDSASIALSPWATPSAAGLGLRLEM